MATILVITLFAPVAAQAQVRTESPASTRSMAADDALWQDILALRDAAPPPDQRGLARFDWEVSNRRQLLQRLQSYETLFPGGARRDEALALELQSRFDLISLGGGTWTELRDRATALRDNPPTPAVLHEAAYWLIFCDREAARRAVTSAPPAPSAERTVEALARVRRVAPDPARNAGALSSAGSVLAADAGLLDSYRRYCSAYPLSRHTPRLTSLLFESAERAGDAGAMRQISQRLSKDFPNHPFALYLSAVTRRAEARGRPFWISFRRAGDGVAVDSRQMAGKPILVVVWAGFDDSARGVVREIEEFRRGAEEWQIIGVNIDSSDVDCERAVQELQLAWPQWNDGQGWATQFLLEWGIREVPFVIAIDREGRLSGTIRGDRWRELVRDATGK